MPRRTTIAALTVLTSPLAPAADSPATDDWPRYGHDGALTGRSSLAGDIVEPRPAWSLSIAGASVTLDLLPEPGEATLSLPAEAASGLHTGPAWDLEPGRETHHARWADLVPDSPGLERVGWDNTWTTARICRLQCFAGESPQGKPQLLWQTDPPEADIFNPLDVVIDIDGDGVQEVVVAAHYRVMVFEGTTGRKESELSYHQSRPYGWMGVFDVERDGKLDVITLGDFQPHFDVLGHDPSRPEKERLSVKWRRDIATDITRRERWPQIGPDPVGDFAGDGKLEIAINYFNERGDGEWHAQVIDAASGAVLADVPRRFLDGSADVDGDGRRELFVTATSGVVVPRLGLVEIRRCDGGETPVVHAASDSAWAVADLPRLGETWSTTATDGMRRVLAAGPAGARAWWLQWRRELRPHAASAAEATLSLAALQLDAAGGVVEAWRVSGLPADTSARDFAADPAPRARIEARLAPGESCALAAQGARPVVVVSARLAGPNAMPVAARLERGKPVAIVVEAAGGRILAVEPPAAPGTLPAVHWTAPGRGMADGSRLCGLAACDLDGDGDREVLAADEAPGGEAALAAYDARGAQRWRARFDAVPGRTPLWNQGGLTFFWPGRFRNAGHDDVFVSLRRGFMHSDAGVLVDGKNGREVWRQAAAIAADQFHWGYAGNVIAAADVAGTGADEIVNLYPVCYWAGDGATGGLVHARDLAARKVVPAWAAYGEPMVWDAASAAGKEVLLDSGYILALLDARGNALWHGPPRVDYPTGKPDDGIGGTTDTRHALADLEGDGRLALVSAGYADGFRAIDPAGGKVLWAIDAPAPTQPKVSACNVDGRRGDEAIYAAGNALVAVTGTRGAGKVLWTWSGPAALSLPAFADVDGDGKAEVIVRSADGVIHCLDGPEMR